MVKSLSESPLISFVIPVYNRAAELRICLPEYQNLTYGKFEIIIVDNGSADETRKTAEKFGARVYSYTTEQNANACRNFGASKASGEIIIFIDSDVIPSPDLIEVCIREFNSSDAAALVGTYMVRHRNNNISSLYKNFWIRHSYLRKAGEIGWIFGAVTAIRKHVFEETEGFNTNLHAAAGIDDIELGTRIDRAGYRITLCPEMEVEHLKSYNFASLMKNQFERSAGFFKMAAAQNAVSKSLTKGVYNVYPSFIFSVILAPIIIVLPKLSFIFLEVLIIEVLLLVVYGMMNFRFLKDFYKHFGIKNTLSAGGLLFMDHLVCFGGVGFAFGKNAASRLLQMRQSEDKKELPEV